MALYEGVKKVNGTRSYTKLVKSGHMSPAEDWVIDPRIATDSNLKSVFEKGVLLHYDYGGPGMTDVIIPMGRIVGVAGAVKDFKTKQYKTTITFPGMSTNNNVIGVVPYNITKDYTQEDRFGGNQPSVITLDYISLPYLPGVEPSTNYNSQGVADEENRISKGLQMPWGSVLGADVVEGDYLKASPSGRFIKWKKGTDNFCDVVGQVLAVDLNTEPWGWFKWMLKDPSLRSEEDAFINRSGASNLPSDGGYPYDPSYADGNNVFQQWQSELVNDPTGYPGLHDGSGNYPGYGKNDTVQSATAVDFFEGTESEDTDIKVYEIKDINGEPINHLDTIISLKLMTGGSKDQETILTEEDYTVDYAKGKIFIPYKSKYGKCDLKLEYLNKYYGIPSYIDFKGVVGSLFVLLKR